MNRKDVTYSTAAKAGLPQLRLDAGDRGEVHAIVSRFGNVDHAGDVIRSGAFTKSLARWRASGDPIPVIWSHSWGEPFDHIGVVTDARENELGLEVRYRLDVETNPKAAQVFRLLKERRVREHSFAYDIQAEAPRADGANELLELDIIELGPTLKGMNPETILLGVKNHAGQEDAEARRRADDPWVYELDKGIIDLETDGAPAAQVVRYVKLFLWNLREPATETARIRADIEALVPSAPPKESDAEFRKRMEQLYPEAWAEVERAATTAREAEAAAERIAAAQRVMREQALPPTPAPRVDPMMRPVG